MKNKFLKRITTVILTATLVFSHLYIGEYNIKAETAGREVSVSEEDIIKLPENLINYDSVDKECKQFVMESLNGIYFLNDNVLSFLSLDTCEAEIIYTFDNVVSSYKQGNQLYILGEKKYEIFDLVEKKWINSFSLIYPDAEIYEAVAIGADALGRVYIAANGWGYSDLYLYSADGKILSERTAVDEIYSFEAFDSENGNFYVEAYNKCFYGYPGIYSRIVKFGTVVDNTIQYREDFVDVLIDVEDAYPHQGNIELIGNKYIVINSTYYENMVVYDSQIELYQKYMTLERKNNEMGHEAVTEDIDSVGVRAVYNEKQDSVIAYTKDKKVVEYNPHTGESLREFTATHHVFNLLMMDEKVILIEKEEDGYYLEMVDWSDIEGISIVCEKENMMAGEAQQLIVETGRKYEAGPFVWESSDNHIISVTEDGTAIAWKEGTAVITCALADGTHKAEYSITVGNEAIVTGESTSVSVAGVVSNNRYKNIYSRWGKLVDSYLIENDNQTLTRVEYIEGTKIIVENYSTGYEPLDRKEIEFELNSFGGFYCGNHYNYFVFGQGNNEENDDCEVMRVVKYSKDWKRLEAVSLYGEDTTIPFYAGSLRITENAGKIYIHTCHQKYTSANDGQRHQENMTYVLDEGSMSISRIDEGTVSHSFNQYVQTDENYVYRLDHGDAYPRAVYISRVNIENTFEREGAAPLRINGDYGDNDTGVSIGGFELSEKNCLVVGNSVVQEDYLTYDAFGQRNIFLTITDKEMENSKIIWLTDYEESDGITPCTPQLVKLSDNHFLVMWEELDHNTYEYKMHLVTVDSQGNITSDIEKCDYHLSDCQPIVTDNGMVKWYVTDGEDMMIYELNPYDLPEYTNEDNKKEEDTGKNEENTGKNEEDNTGFDDEKGESDDTENNNGNEEDNDNPNQGSSGESEDIGIGSNENSQMIGDLDEDEQITLKDAQIALKVALGIINIENTNRADIDEDTLVTLQDAQIILKLALGIKV